MTVIYHLARKHAWSAARGDSIYRGTAEDRIDGFIHFSTGSQVAQSAARHRAGEADLILVACDAEKLDGIVRWEPSRGGELFPHLYGDLPLAAVLSAVPLPLGKDAKHVFPDLD